MSSASVSAPIFCSLSSPTQPPASVLLIAFSTRSLAVSFGAGDGFGAGFALAVCFALGAGVGAGVGVAAAAGVTLAFWSLASSDPPRAVQPPMPTTVTAAMIAHFFLLLILGPSFRGAGSVLAKLLMLPFLSWGSGFGPESAGDRPLRAASRDVSTSRRDRHIAQTDHRCSAQ